MQSSSDFLIFCESLVKIYRIENQEILVLQGLDLEVRPGEMVAVAGASGSGKTTLLNILGGLDTPDAGQCQVAGWDLTHLRSSQRIVFRRHMIGYLWQQSGRNLLTHLPIQANVETPMKLQGIGSRQAKKRALEMLSLVGLGGMEKKYPYQLSGGEQQRAALAVALANQPPLLLADEPTGELDTQTADAIVQLLRQTNQQLGTTMLIVTHDHAVAEKADRMISIRDGRVSSETAMDEVDDGTTMRRESVVVDRVGRLQLPHAAIERIAFHGRADVHFDDEHIEVWPLSARSLRREKQNERPHKESEANS